MARSNDDQRLSNAKAVRRTEAALGAAFQTPHKTYEDSKIGNHRAKPTESPGHRKPVKK
jgi:hypothetical protein